MLQVIFHIDEMEKWPLVLANVNNLILANEEEKEIIVLANAIAVRGYRDDYEHHFEVERLAQEGVIFKVCLKALNNQGLSRNHLIREVETVETGVLELAEKQKEGFAYIRP